MPASTYDSSHLWLACMVSFSVALPRLSCKDLRQAAFKCSTIISQFSLEIMPVMRVLITLGSGNFDGQVFQVNFTVKYFCQWSCRMVLQCIKGI